MVAIDPRYATATEANKNPLQTTAVTADLSCKGPVIRPAIASWPRRSTTNSGMTTPSTSRKTAPRCSISTATCCMK
ncbi:hypothetical protein CBM2637_A180008 [Cupriavidus taiwanensis]|nr:hypothetical protein CBM2637_A180008 [Cupriavidus taiwanensis]